MDIVVDFQPLIRFLDQPLLVILWRIFLNGGWVATLLVLSWAWFLYHKHSQQVAFVAKTPHTYLAIDVPRENVQSLRAAEQMFSALWGVYSLGYWLERNWEGKVPLGFSLELVSLEGAIQYLVRTPVKFRDLVEAAIYAQYPDAEISEVQDYMAAVPADAWKPDSPYKLWGTQARFSKHNAYPIRTYTSFDNELAVDERLVDPLAGLLEAFSRLGPGELLAVQYLIRPAGDSWTNSAMKVVKKILGEKATVKEHVGDKLVTGAMKGIAALGNVVTPSGAAAKVEKKDRGNLLHQLTPGSTDVLKAIERKMSKSCFEVKMRHVYIARKESYQKTHGVMAFWGALRPFAGTDLNALRPGSKITTDVGVWRNLARITKLRRKILVAFRERSYFKGTSWIIMSAEEMASLWHFPLVTVKVPMLHRAGAHRGEAPSELVSVVAPAGTMLGAAPTPTLSAEAALDLDDKTFEQRLALGQSPAHLGDALATLPNDPPPAEQAPAPEQAPRPPVGSPPPNLPIA